MSRTLVVHLDGDATAARQARAFVREVVGDEPELDDLLLVTSELVTNAVMHAGTASDLEVRLTPEEVEVRLSDGDPRVPRRRTLLGAVAGQGRGLTLLSALSSRWGVDRRTDGKTVWAVLLRR